MRRIWLPAALMIATLAVPARAAVYGTDTNGTRLVSVDPATGTVNGLFTFPNSMQVEGMAADPANPVTFYGVTASPAHLVRITDQGSWSVTDLGTLDAATDPYALTFSGDGVLYAWGAGGL
jgi:hypothetical protein